MKTQNFELVKPVRLIPKTGKTNVSIQSTGKFEVVFGNVCKPRRRDELLHQTDCARLYQTPSGSKRKVVVILPTEMTQKSVVMNEITRLFLKAE